MSQGAHNRGLERKSEGYDAAWSQTSSAQCLHTHVLYFYCRSACRIPVLAPFSTRGHIRSVRFSYQKQLRKPTSYSASVRPKLCTTSVLVIKTVKRCPAACQGCCRDETCQMTPRMRGIWSCCRKRGWRQMECRYAVLRALRSAQRTGLETADNPYLNKCICI